MAITRTLANEGELRDLLDVLNDAGQVPALAGEDGAVALRGGDHA